MFLAMNTDEKLVKRDDWNNMKIRAKGKRLQIWLNGKQVADYLYTKRELDALIRGGVQRIHIGNLPTGEHELVALFIGKGPKGRDYKRGATTTFKKGLGPKYVELKIVDQTKNYQPEFDIKEW